MIVRELKVFAVPEDFGPDAQQYKDPTSNRRGVWKPGRFHERERNFSHTFSMNKSYNTRADKDLENARKVLTWYRAFTRNEETDLSAPIPEHLVRDANFVAMIEALMRRQKKTVKKHAMEVAGHSVHKLQDCIHEEKKAIFKMKA